MSEDLVQGAEWPMRLRKSSDYTENGMDTFMTSCFLVL